MHARILGAGGIGQDEPSEESMAAYADAANFQTNGAINLAIDGWNKFLKRLSQAFDGGQGSPLPRGLPHAEGPIPITSRPRKLLTGR